MQKILKTKNERCRNAIPLMGKMLCLVEVTSISKPVGEDPITVFTFNDGESIPPCYAFGWYFEKDDESMVEIIRSLDEFGEMFDMTKEDTSILSSFIIDTAAQLNILTIPMDGGIVFTSTIINNLAKKNYSLEDLEKLKATEREIAVASSAAGPATLLGEIVKTGMKRYNKVNLDDKVGEIAKIIKTCKFIDDEGNSKPISLTGVDNILKRAKDMLFISPTE